MEFSKTWQIIAAIILIAIVLFIGLSANPRVGSKNPSPHYGSDGYTPVY